MKIAMICQPWEEIVSPIGRSSSSLAIVAYQLACQLAPSNNVVIYARRGAGQPRRELDEQGIVIHRIRNTTKGLYQLLDRMAGMMTPPRPFFASRLHSLGYWRKVARDVRKERFDVVYLQSFAQHVCTIHRLNPDIRIVLHMQGESLAQLDRMAVEKQLKEVDIVVGCSDFITEQIRRRFPQFRHRCRTVYNGVDTEYFKIADKANRRGQADRRIVFVGRVSPEKGVHVLLEAFEQVLDRFPNARLDVVGVAGSMIALPYSYHIGLSRDPEVTKLARYYGTNLLEKVRRQLLPGGLSYFADLQLRLKGQLAPKVTFHGQLPHSDLLDVYRNADVLVFPSVWNEPFGMPIVEAMACGLPVIATRGGGIPEIVEEGTTGLLVERGDAAELSRAIVRLLEDNALRQAFADSGRRRASTLFTWERAGHALALACEELSR
jgi:glycosyltransferase involved in cell wall biosynthesis